MAHLLRGSYTLVQLCRRRRDGRLGHLESPRQRLLLVVLRSQRARTRRSRARSLLLGSGTGTEEDGRARIVSQGLDVRGHVRRREGGRDSASEAKVYLGFRQVPLGLVGEGDRELELGARVRVDFGGTTVLVGGNEGSGDLLLVDEAGATEVVERGRRRGAVTGGTELRVLDDDGTDRSD